MSEFKRMMDPPNLADGFVYKRDLCLGVRGERRLGTSRFLSTCAVGLFVFGVGVSPSVGSFQSEQSTPKPAAQSDAASSKPDTPGLEDRDDAAKSPKSLDELLGVPETSSASGSQSGASASDAAEREQAKRLQQSLDEASLQDLVQKALEGMRSASSRLTDQSDAGLGTQRIQEDVVKSLERLLEEAQKQQKKQLGSRSSSSSRSRSKPQQGGDPQDPSERNGQQRQPQRSREQGQQKSSSSASGDAEAEVAVRETDEAAVGGELSEARVEWGQLPERVRELVLQGRRDRVSTIYERLTREYYRRLAEEASK